MPFVIRRPRPLRMLGPVLACSAIAAVAPAAASAQCSVSTSGESQAFAGYGDYSSYTLVPGGSFTSGAPGWTLDDASVHSGGSGRSSYITLGAGGEAISPAFCVGSQTPTFRFYSRETGSSSWVNMNVYLIWTNQQGVQETTCVNGLAPSSSWAPSPIWGLGSILPTENGAQFSVQLAFEPTAGGSAVQVSDVYADPYSKG